MFHQRDHVSHSHKKSYEAFEQLLGNGELIQVTRVIIVNGSPQKVPHVTNTGRTGCCPRRLKSAKLGESCAGKIREQPSLQHDSAGDAFQKGTVVHTV